MTKEVLMTFRVEPELRADFADAAEAQHVPAAQLLRAFMRDYVQKARAIPSTTAAERQAREDALKFSVASVGLEGFVVSPDYVDQAQRFAKGEIEFSELTEAVNEQARRIRLG